MGGFEAESVVRYAVGSRVGSIFAKSGAAFGSNAE